MRGNENIIIREIVNIYLFLQLCFLVNLILKQFCILFSKGVILLKGCDVVFFIEIFKNYFYFQNNVNLDFNICIIERKSNKNVEILLWQFSWQVEGRLIFFNGFQKDGGVVLGGSILLSWEQF